MVKNLKILNIVNAYHVVAIENLNRVALLLLLYGGILGYKWSQDKEIGIEGGFHETIKECLLVQCLQVTKGENKRLSTAVITAIKMKEW